MWVEQMAGRKAASSVGLLVEMKVVCLGYWRVAKRAALRVERRAVSRAEWSVDLWVESLAVLKVVQKVEQLVDSTVDL